ncbi:MAG: hypothetical protein Q8P90_03360 [bacterium]|nr:hypothetical protein [bacterium]
MNKKKYQAKFDAFIKRHPLLLPVIVSVLCGLVLLIIALKSSGSDWFFSEVLAETIYSAIVYHHEFPFFSYFLNGGTPFIQDPQGPLLSISTLWILIFGPWGGLRFAAFFWGFIGTFSCWGWLRPKLGSGPALVSATAWILSMGFFWRLVVGHDMFLWHLALPLFLIVIEKLIFKPTWKNSILLGLLTGLFILGPSLHSLLYFIIPAVVIWYVVLLVGNHKRIAIKNIFLFSAMAIVIALAIASPKVAAWSRLDMVRETQSESAMYLKDALISIVDTQVRSDRGYLLDEKYERESWGIWESNVAATPIILTLAILALFIVAFKKEKPNSLFIFSITLFFVGLFIATNSWFWQVFRELSNGSFRVSGRFLGLANFSIIILAGIATKYLTGIVSKKIPHLSAIFILSTFVFSALLIYQASVTLSPYVSSGGNILKPITAIWNHSKKKTDSPMLTGVNHYYYDQEIEANQISSGNLYLLYGHKIIGDSVSEIPLDDFMKILPNKDIEIPVSPELSPDRLEVFHTKLVISNLQPLEEVNIRLKVAPLGQEIITEPSGANITLEENAGTMTLINNENYLIEKITIKPKSPVPVIAWIVSILTLIASIGYLVAKSGISARIRFQKNKA